MGTLGAAGVALDVKTLTIHAWIQSGVVLSEFCSTSLVADASHGP
jgi:hypothetical protein